MKIGGVASSQIYMEFGLKIAISFALFVYGGYELDGLLSTEPLFTLIGVAVGIIALITSFVLFIKKIINEVPKKNVP